MADENPIDIGFMSLPAEVQQAVDAQAAVNTCEHAWASGHIPGHLVYWVSQCMLCGEVNWDELDGEVSLLVSAERERIAAQMDTLADNYPEDVFTPTGTSSDAIGGTAMRHAYRNAARTIREAAWHRRRRSCRCRTGLT